MPRAKPKNPKTHSPAVQENIDHVYLLTLDWQCNAFISAIGRVNESINAHNAVQNDRTREQVFSDAQSAIMFAANIGKMLWPERPKRKTRAIAKPRGVRMRSLTGITTDDKRLRDVSLRDSFAHMDEKIDLWTLRSKSMLGIHLIATDDAIAYLDREDRLTWLNPQTLEVSMFGSKQMNLQELMDSVVAVKSATRKAILDILSRQPHP